MTKSPSATITPASYFQVGGIPLMRIEQALAARLYVPAVLDVVRATNSAQPLHSPGLLNNVSKASSTSPCSAPVPYDS